MLTCAWAEDWMAGEISPETDWLKWKEFDPVGERLCNIFSKESRNSSEVGGHYPEQIFIFIWIFACRSSGDICPDDETVKKVTVVGRPTLGILDYNCCTVDCQCLFMFSLLFVLSVDQEEMTDQVCSTRYRIHEPYITERNVDLDRVCQGWFIRVMWNRISFSRKLIKENYFC